MNDLWASLLSFLRWTLAQLRRVWLGLNSLLFSSSELASWIRLSIFMFAFMTFLLAFFPLMDALARLIDFFFVEIFPEIRNSARVLWDLFFGPQGPAPPPDFRVVTLPQPGLLDKLMLLFTSQTLIDLLQRSMLGVIPLGLSILFSALYFQYLHNLPRFGSTLMYLLRAVFPLPKPRVKLVNGVVVQPVGQMSIFRFGGPVNLQADAQTAALLEPPSGAVSFAPPGRRRLVGAFETLRTALFLGEDEIEVSAQGRTLDGVRLGVNRARFRYRLYQSPGDPATPVVQLESTALKLVYRHWLGSDWNKPDKRRKSLHDLVKSELLDFIAHRQLAEFLGSLLGADQLTAAGYQRLNQLSLFADHFTQNAGRYALEAVQTPMLQLEWLAQGEWQILSEIDWRAQLDTWQRWLSNRQRSQYRSQARLKQQGWTQEIDQHLAGLSLDELAKITASPRDTAREVMVAYKQALEKLLQTAPASEPDAGEAGLRSEIGNVLQHLDRLIRNC